MERQTNIENIAELRGMLAELIDAADEAHREVLEQGEYNRPVGLGQYFEGLRAVAITVIALAELVELKLTGTLAQTTRPTFAEEEDDEDLAEYFIGGEGGMRRVTAEEFDAALRKAGVL